MFEDILSAGGNIISSLQLGLIGILAFMWVPLFIFWVGTTAFFLYFIFSRNIEIINPKDWTWNVVVVKPYADGKTGAWFVRGARCVKNGLQRFKLGNPEKFVMQKIDMKNIYRNGEVFVVSLGTVRKFFATIKTDFDNAQIVAHIDNPKMAQLYHVDSLAEGELNYINDHVPLLNNIIIYWSIATTMLGFSTFIVVYPWFLRGIGYGR
jgi:hypothetical protein